MTEPTALSRLRHLYQNMVNGAVRDTASAKRIAEGLLAPAIEALERATPQPTQAQAGAVPLTDEQIEEVMDLVSDWGMQSHLRGEAELDAHNPEATEDEITYAKECAEKERAAWNAIKDKLQAHGIKGGQHGSNT